jgi:hypothetical protein
MNTQAQKIYKIFEAATMSQDGHPQDADYKSYSGFLIVDNQKITVYNYNYQKAFDLTCPMLNISEADKTMFNGKGKIDRSNVYYIFKADAANPREGMLKIVQPNRNLSITYKMGELKESVVSYSVLKGLLVSDNQ